MGWLSSKSVTVNPYNPTVITLAAFPYYNLTTASQSVVINVGTYYLVYNRAVGINAQVDDVIDKVRKTNFLEVDYCDKMILYLTHLVVPGNCGTIAVKY